MQKCFLQSYGGFGYAITVTVTITLFEHMQGMQQVHALLSAVCRQDLCGQKEVANSTKVWRGQMRSRPQYQFFAVISPLIEK